jgi:hypothetical protein
MLKVLKTQSVMASWASACTLEFLINLHQNQQKPLMATTENLVSYLAIHNLGECSFEVHSLFCIPVESIMAIAGMPS